MKKTLTLEVTGEMVLRVAIAGRAPCWPSTDKREMMALALDVLEGD